MGLERGYKLHNSTNDNIKLYVTWGVPLEVGEQMNPYAGIEEGLTISADDWGMVPTPEGALFDLLVTDMNDRIKVVKRSVAPGDPTILFFNGETIHE
ncbi:MAG: hypothetical protein ACK2T0_04985 [Anaerolineales bacterium]